MAKEPAAATRKIDPTKQYRVTLSRVVAIGKLKKTMLSPRHDDNVVSGELLLTLPTDAVMKFEEA